jgi:hypothetical protein
MPRLELVDEEKEQRNDEATAKILFAKRVSELLSAFQAGRLSRANVQFEICKEVSKLI